MIQAVAREHDDRPREDAPGGEHEPGGDHDDALGARADADVALEAERLGAGARVGDEERAGDRGDRDDDEDVVSLRAKTYAIAASMKPSLTRSVVESRNAPNGVDLPPARASAPSRMSRTEPATKDAAPSQ